MSQKKQKSSWITLDQLGKAIAEKQKSNPFPVKKFHPAKAA